jgi:hypothetical protein
MAEEALALLGQFYQAQEMAAQVEGLEHSFLNQAHLVEVALEQALQDKVIQAAQEALQHLLIFLSPLVGLLFEMS